MMRRFDPLLRSPLAFSMTAATVMHATTPMAVINEVTMAQTMMLSRGRNPPGSD